MIASSDNPWARNIRIFFILSILVKQTFIFPILVVYLFHIKDILTGLRYNFRINKKTLTNLSLPFILLTLFIITFNILFPNFLASSIAIARPDPSISQELRISLFSGGIPEFFQNFISIIKLQSDIVLVFILITLLSSLYLFYKKKEFIISYSFFMVLFHTILNLFFLGENLFHEKRLIIIAPFMVIILLKLKYYTLITKFLN